MPRMLPPFPPALSLALLLGAAAAARAETPALDNLVANSPFGTAPGLHGKSDAATPLEFRGVIYEGATAYFSIFEAGTRKSAWVELNEDGLNYVAKSYDAANAKLVVEFQGRTLTLALVQAPKSAHAPLPLAANPPPPAGGNPAKAPPAPNPQLPAQIAEEIRRRRALRQQAATPAAPPAKP